MFTRSANFSTYFRLPLYIKSINKTEKIGVFFFFFPFIIRVYETPLTDILLESRPFNRMITKEKRQKQ